MGTFKVILDRDGKTSVLTVRASSHERAWVQVATAMAKAGVPAQNWTVSP